MHRGEREVSQAAILLGVIDNATNGCCFGLAHTKSHSPMHRGDSNE